MYKPLDVHYLEFHASTKAAFAQYPQLEPLRWLIFKQLLVQRRVDGMVDWFKRWARPLVKRSRTRLERRPADALLWLESRREVIREAILPVYHELLARGVSTELVSFYGPKPPIVPLSARVFEFPARSVTPRWALGAWGALATCEPELKHHSLERSFHHAAAMLQALYDELHRLFDAVTPRVVMCAATQPIGGAALTVVARARGVASLLLQHGIPGADFVPCSADTMLTWGPSSRDIMLPIGLSADQMLTVGSPRHDTMRPSGNGRLRQQFLAAVGRSDLPTFAFFSNGHDSDRTGNAAVESVAWLERTAARHANDLNIVVRLHPNEDGALYRGTRHLTVMDPKLDLGLILQGSDWFGSLCSTVLYDGVVYGRTPWQFYSDEWPELVDNWRSGHARRVPSEEAFEAMVCETLATGADHRIHPELVRQIFTNHGRATQAVADVVESRIGGRHVARPEGACTQ